MAGGTMDELLRELNYDFNIHTHEIRNSMRHFDLRQRRTIEAWIHKLHVANQTLQEVQLRNDFMLYLSRNCDEGHLLPPFDQPPPGGYVLNATHLQPSLGTDMTGAGSSKPVHEAYIGSTKAAATRRSELFKRSPDGGAFLVSQPVPRCGAFCYLAIVSKHQNNPN